MLRITATVSDLPAPLLDAITDHHVGLREVRLRRVLGRKGTVATGVAWTLTGETSGDATMPAERPEDDPDTIAREVMEGALEVLATGDAKDRRFQVELVVAEADGSTTKHTAGFEVDEDAQPVTRGSIEGEMANLVRTLSDALSQSQQQNNRAMQANTAALRAASSTFQSAMEFRLAAFEDHYHAALYGSSGVQRRSADDEKWKEKAAETTGKLIDAITIAATSRGPSESKGGDESDGEPKTAGSRKLRDALAKLGKTITDEQQGRLIAAVGISTMKLLLDAGKASTDADAARHIHDFLGRIHDKHAKVTAVLNAEQQDLLGDVLAIYESMVEVES